MVHVHEYDDRRHVTMIDQEHKLLFGYEMNKGPVRVIKISFSFKYHREVHRIVNSIGLNNEQSVHRTENRTTSNSKTDRD